MVDTEAALPEADTATAIASQSADLGADLDAEAGIRVTMTAAFDPYDPAAWAELDPDLFDGAGDGAPPPATPKKPPADPVFGGAVPGQFVAASNTEANSSDLEDESDGAAQVRDLSSCCDTALACSKNGNKIK